MIKTVREPPPIHRPRVLGEIRADVENEAIVKARPLTRGDCVGSGDNAVRPCPWVGCRHHLAIEVKSTGTLRIRFDVEDAVDSETCSLDVADRGGHELRVVGRALRVSGESVRQIEEIALAQFKKVALTLASRDDLLGPWEHVSVSSEDCEAE